MNVEMHKDLPVMAYPSMAAWVEWLKANHQNYAAIWVKFAKKGAGIPTLTYEEAREGALIYGWIDGLINKYDERYYLIRFNPRRPRSTWSKINRTIVEGLIRDGKMQPAGMTQVEAALQDGRWEAAYDSPSTMAVPDDFQVALNASPTAKAFFATVSRSNRYAFLYRIHEAKRPETRASRIAKFTAMLEEGKTLH